MKLILIGLALIAFPLITGVAEWHESDEQAVKRDINWMADHDRSSQAVRPMNRRMAYATIGKKNPRRCGNTNRGTKETYQPQYTTVRGACQ